MADVISDVIQQSGLPDTLRVIYSAELQHTAMGNLIYDQFTERKGEFLGQKGSTVVWTVYQNLPPSIRPLIEDQDVGNMGIADFQVGLSINEYGTAIGTTEKLDLLSYFGPISSMVRTMLAPQMGLTNDILARNAMIDPVKAQYRNFANGTSRATLTVPTYDAQGNVSTVNGALTPGWIKKAAYNLNTRRIPTVGGGYIGIVHPAQVYDLRSNPYWIDVLKYTQPETILNGEIGKIHGVRFVEAHNGRLPNGGATTIQTTLTGDTKTNVDTLAVASTTTFAAGDEVTIHRYKTVPDGTDETEEHVVIKSIDSATRVTLRSKTTVSHNSGDYVTNGTDVYPACFIGAVPAVGRGSVLEPEVRVATPTDKLRRQYHVGWYGLYGYGIIRDWAVEIVESTAGQSSAPAFPW